MQCHISASTGLGLPILTELLDTGLYNLWNPYECRCVPEQGMYLLEREAES